MDKFDKNEPVDFNTLPGMNQSPTGPSFQDQGPKPPQDTGRAALKLVLYVVGGIIGFFAIRGFL